MDMAGHNRDDRTNTNTKEYNLSPLFIFSAFEILLQFGKVTVPLFYFMGFVDAAVEFVLKPHVNGLKAYAYPAA